MAGPAPAPKPWGAPLERLDKRWTGLEQLLAVFAIVLEIVTLTAWVSVKGLATDSSIGVLFRAVFGAILLGLSVHAATRAKARAGATWPRLAVLAAIVAGLGLAPLWATAGNDYAANWAEWLQSSSSIALVGGPRGLVTRLTLWLALLGGSMAASKGKHINIDVATRYLPNALVKPVAMLGWVVAALVCFAASYGFVDSIAVTKFRAEAFRSCGDTLCDTPVSERLGKVAEGASADFFLLRRQLGLDLRTLPRVIGGKRYDGWLTASEWNAWIASADWGAHFPAEAVARLPMPTDDPGAKKSPMVIAPDTGEGRDLLIRDLNFILPFGLLMIGLKFLLRTLRAASGHVRLDPGHAHEDEDLSAGHDALHEAEAS